MSSDNDNSVLSAKRENAAKVLREILDRMGIEAEVSAFDDGERVILDAHGPESGLVIGKKGATLDALQYLINRIVSKKPSDGPGVVVDAEGYRGRREDALTDLAQRLAEKAMKTGRPVPVEPMNPHDRRIIHVALAEHDGRADGVGRRGAVSAGRDLSAQSADAVSLAGRAAAQPGAPASVSKRSSSFGARACVSACARRSGGRRFGSPVCGAR